MVEDHYDNLIRVYDIFKFTYFLRAALCVQTGCLAHILFHFTFLIADVGFPVYFVLHAVVFGFFIELLRFHKIDLQPKNY